MDLPVLNGLERLDGGDGASSPEALAAAHLREGLDFIPEGIAFYDADDRIVVWNARYAELNNESGGLLVEGARFRDLLEAGLRRGVYPEAAGREAEWLEERLAVRRSGMGALEQQNQGHWLRIVERRTRGGGVVSICEDITELKQREATLRLMFEESPVPMWVVDAETWRYLAVNEAAVAHYGYSRERFLEMRVCDVYAECELEALRAASSTTESSGAFRSARAWRQRKAYGSEIIVTPMVNLIRYHDRPAFMAAQFDVTVSALAEASMAAARDQAEAANRAKSEFLANMSHEIRTPLNGVLGVVGVLARTELTEPQREMVRIIRSASESLERLLSDILDLARVEAGRVEVEAEPFEVEEAVASVAALFSARAAEKGLELRVMTAPEARGMVTGDERRIKQILGNLLSNAVKFTSTGGVSVGVEVRQTADGPLLAFAVSDTGIGFDAARMERLFGRFEQEDGSITRRYGGSGLGLAISRSLAEALGGRLHAVAEPGRGATFTLELPLQRPVGAGGAPASAVEGRRLRVLLADDHPTNRKVVELMLAGLDVELTCVDDGEQAIEQAVSDRFDVVLMDMQMPVLDGLSAIRRIREHERGTGAERTLIYTLSANALPQHAAAAHAAGADRHLTKPINAAELIGALAELGGRAAPSQAA